MAISSTGIGSGLDVSSIVSQLVAIERKPIDNLKTAASTIQTQISAYGKAQSLTSTLRDTAAALGKPGLWTQTAASSADATAVSATTTGTVAAGDYLVSVSKLAQAHTLYSDTISGALGAGTMTITSGTKSVNLNFTDPATTLDQVRDAINGADAGVTAAIVKDSGGNTRLSLTAKASGVANQITVATTGAGYATLDGAALHQGQAAQDAQLTINGVPVTASSNDVSDAVAGLSLKLTKETSSPVKITAASDEEAQKKAVDDFVAAYNALNTFLAEQTKYDAATKKAGSLQGDSSALSMRSQLRSLVQQDGGISTAFKRLGDVGLELQKDGSLLANSTKLSAALKQPGEMSKLFTHTDTVTPANNGLGVAFRQLADRFTGTDGMLSVRTGSLQASLKRNQTEQERMEDRVARTQARLEKQYQALDSKMGSLNALSSYVSQQIASWNKSSE